LVVISTVLSFYLTNVSTENESSFKGKLSGTPTQQAYSITEMNTLNHVNLICQCYSLPTFSKFSITWYLISTYKIILCNSEFQCPSALPTQYTYSRI